MKNTQIYLDIQVPFQTHATNEAKKAFESMFKMTRKFSLMELCVSSVVFHIPTGVHTAARKAHTHTPSADTQYG